MKGKQTKGGTGEIVGGRKKEQEGERFLQDQVRSGCLGVMCNGIQTAN